jgi:urease accessory protein
VYENESIVGLARAARDRSRAAHLAPLFGASLAALDLSRAETLALYMFLALRGLASAAVRLGVVGPHEAQRLHARHARTLDAVLAECSAITPGNAAQAAPVADILSATHDTLYARLFQS